MAEKRYPAACAKFEESQNLDPGLGTQLNLADCYEKIGRTASAWALFLEVEAKAKAVHQTPREQYARQRATQLASKLAKLTLEVRWPNHDESREIQRDRVVVRHPQWGVSIPVDPGLHSIQVVVQGQVLWSQEIKLNEAEHKTIVVPDIKQDTKKMKEVKPVFAALEPNAKSSSDQVMPRSNASYWWTTAILGGVGLVSLGVGTAFGAISLGKNSDSKQFCQSNLCAPTGVDLRRQSIQAGRVSTIALSAGGAFAITSLMMWIFGPSSKKETSPVSVSVAPNALFLSGTW